MMDLKERYDSFQKDAVKAIKKDFAKKQNGRFLLVIPTGGGKTYTAVKAVCALFDDGILDPEKDKIFWTAHRIELTDQAIKTFKDFTNNNKTCIALSKNIVVGMISKMKSLLNSDPTIRIVVIDEAHHSAAKSYQSVFDRAPIGILGLTATPSRHDGKPLEYEKESYSIGFPELVKKGLILSPNIVKIEGGDYEIADIGCEEDLEKLDDLERNNKILEALQSGHEDYSKVIIYVGTKKHAVNLCSLLANSELTNEYESISYLTGKGNSRGQDRDDYIEQEKKYSRSIIINVQMLTEGYDDPVVNTVVMACPSKSKLYYMQAIGRAIRINPANELKKAYVIEVEDRLPNIRYRIDNRWLFSDISDALEPVVSDLNYSNAETFRKALQSIYTEYSVPSRYRQLPKDYDEDSRYSLLMFREYHGKGDYVYKPILIDNTNRIPVSRLYNFISEKMTGSSAYRKKINLNAVFKMAGNASYSIVPEELEKTVFDAMINAGTIVAQPEEDKADWVVDGSPWIRYFSLNFKDEEAPSDELLAFIDEMVNKDIILDRLMSKNYEQSDVLIRLPLPLKGFIGKFITEHDYEAISEFLTTLNQIKDEPDGIDHRQLVNEILAGASLPLEIQEVYSLLIIVREDLEYAIKNI